MLSIDWYWAMKDEAMIVLVVVEWLENSKRTQSDSIPSPLWNQKQQKKVTRALRSP